MAVPYLKPEDNLKAGLFKETGGYDTSAFKLPSTAPSTSELPGVYPANEPPKPAPAAPSYSRTDPDYTIAKSVVAPKDPKQITQDIRTEQINAAQERITALSKHYDGEIQRQEQENAKNIGRTDALSGLMGLTGSSAALGRTEKTERGNKQNIELIEAKRANAIQAIYGEVDANVAKLADAALKENSANAKAYLDEVSKNAVGHVQGLAASLEGSTWNDFKAADPDAAKKLVETSGKTEYELQNLWNQAVPEQYRPITAESVAVAPNGNAQIHRSTFNPVTGKTETAIFDTGTPYALYKDAKIVKGDNGANFMPDPNDPTKWINITPKTAEEQEADRLDNELKKSQIAKNYSDARKVEIESSYGMNPKQVTVFNSIVDKYNKSPLIMAADRTTVLKDTISKVRQNLSDGALQMNLSYGYIQALDTYQSAVREGELTNLNQIDSKIGSLTNSIQRIQNGQVVRPDVAKQIADAAEDIINAINMAAQQKEKSFAAQAKVSGIENAWNEYQSAFKASYEPVEADIEADLAETIQNNAQNYDTREELIEALGSVFTENEISREALKAKVYQLIPDR